jgi:Holliday junction resolvase RusA-like endonuclease
MSAITLTLPWPPGVNNLYATVGAGKKQRRVVTARYKAWRTEAIAAIRVQFVRGIKGPFCIALEYTAPDRRKVDLDGRVKAVLDLLVSTGIIEDDHLARRILLAWSESPPSKPGFVSIIIRQAAVGSVMARAA